MGLSNRRWYNQYGQITADNTLLNAEDVKPDVINGATGSTESDPVSDYYGKYLSEQEKLTNDYYAGVVKGLEEKEKAAQDYYAGVVADINQREQAAQNYYKNAMVLAMMDMEKARQTYGAKAEDLARAGLSDSGLSDYAARQFYSAYVNEKQAIRGEENAAMDALAAERADAAAKHKLDLATIADEKSKAAFDQQGALSDLSYQRAEYEAGKQAATEAETVAIKQEGIAAYNTLSYLMSDADSEGNPKTAMSYVQAVQEMRNQGMTEDQIKAATDGYKASITSNVAAAIRTKNIASLLNVSELYFTENGFTADEANAEMEKVRDVRFNEVKKMIESGDYASLRNLLVAYTGDESWANENAKTDDEVGAAAYDIIESEGFGAKDALKSYKAEVVKADVEAEDTLAGLLDVGAKIVGGKDQDEIDAYYGDVSLAVTSAKATEYAGSRDVPERFTADIVVTVAGKEFNLDTHVNPYLYIKTSTSGLKDGTILKMDGKYYILCRTDGEIAKAQWAEVILSGYTDEQKKILTKLLDTSQDNIAFSSKRNMRQNGTKPQTNEQK